MSFNRIQLQKDTKELTKAKAPAKSKDVIYDPKDQWNEFEQVSNFPEINYATEYSQMQNGGENIPIIEDAGSFNEEGFWIPDWETMKQQAKELNAKTVKTKNGAMIYFDDNWNVQSVDDNPQMKSGGSKSKHVVVKQSKIPGANKGLFSNQKFKRGEPIGLAHEDGQPVGDIGNMHNHSDNPNMYSVKVGNKRYVYAKRNIEPGEELTTDYRLQPELEQPEDFMKRGGSTKGLVRMPKPSKKGLASKAYSRSLEATNRLFTENRLFEKPKDRKRKVFDPNAKYYASGGEYGMPLGAGVSQNFIGNRDNFKVGGIPELPLRDNRVNYNAFVNGFDPMYRKQEGGEQDYLELELTPEEIQAYKDGGYIVEDISIPSLNTYQDGGTYTYAGRKDSKYKKDSSGNWMISNKSTGNKYVPIKDPTGKRAKELNRAAVPEQTYDIVRVPSESTDTQFLKNQMKQVGENRLQEYINAANYEKSVIDGMIKEMRSQDFLSPDERRKGLTSKSKVSKERRNKAIQDLKWDAIKKPHETYKDVKKYYEKLDKLDKVKALPKGYDFSTSASAYDILTNPLDAFKYSVSTGDISNMPANYNELVKAGIDPLEHRGGNLVGNVVNTYNPVDIGDKVTHYTKKGDYLNAGLNLLRAAPYAQGLSKVPAIARTLGVLDKYLVEPVEAGLKYAPLANVTRNASPLVNTLGKTATVGNALRARAFVHAAQKSPELLDALGNVISKKDYKSLKKAVESGLDVGYNFFPASPGASQYFLSKAAFNVLQPKEQELINTDKPLLGGTAFDYLSLLRNLPSPKAKGGETNYFDTELTDDEIQDLIDEGYIVEQL